MLQKDQIIQLSQTLTKIKNQLSKGKTIKKISKYENLTEERDRTPNHPPAAYVS